PEIDAKMVVDDRNCPASGGDRETGDDVFLNEYRPAAVGCDQRRDVGDPAQNAVSVEGVDLDQPGRVGGIAAHEEAIRSLDETSLEDAGRAGRPLQADDDKFKVHVGDVDERVALSIGGLGNGGRRDDAGRIGDRIDAVDAAWFG